MVDVEHSIRLSVRPLVPEGFCRAYHRAFAPVVWSVARTVGLPEWSPDQSLIIGLFVTTTKLKMVNDRPAATEAT